MKTKLMKQPYLLLMFSAVLITTACKKEGCTDKKATNYNSAAQKDDGSCKYKTAVTDTTKNPVATQLPNSGFEDWEQVGTPQEEPIRWSSIKTADALASSAPAVAFKDSGRTGNYCIKLKVADPLFGIVANGIITTGRVHASMTPSEGYVYTDANDKQWNTPFESRPDSLVGWYKYTPVSGDFGKIEVVLHKGTHARIPRDQTTSDNEVGRAAFQFDQAKSTWTRFSTPFVYNTSETPNYILGVMQAGDSTVAITGTTLWLDDLKLIYNN